MTRLSTIGTGYTQATILDVLEDGKKFIGYIPTKEEYIVATEFYPFDSTSYGHSHYFGSLAQASSYVAFISRDPSKQAHLERLDSNLSNSIDEMEYYNDDEVFEDIVERMEEIRGLINA